MAYNSTMYPPIVPSAYPASLQTGQPTGYYKFYFSIPNLNSIEDINLSYTQITIKNQNSNLSVLNSNKYYSDIYVTAATLDTSITTDYNYYVRIPLSEIKGGTGLDINQLYKIQIRFTAKKTETGTTIPAPSSYSGSSLSSWLNTYSDNFSEWSKVTIAKFISTPTISINRISSSGVNTLTTQLTDIVGRLSFSNRSETQILKNYKIYLKNSSNRVLYETDTIFTSSLNQPNEINVKIPYLMSNSTRYILQVKYTTSNLYEGATSFTLQTSFSSIDAISIHIDAETDEQNGAIIIHLYSHELVINKIAAVTPTSLVLRRASAETNFTVWEDWRTISILADNRIRTELCDTTIQGGVWYNYGVQPRGVDSSGNYIRGNLIQLTSPVMCIFDNMFLTTGTKQLKIKFNPSISQFKYNVTESQQVTLGNKFPYITRNGNNYYRTFSISGLLSALAEEDYDDVEVIEPIAFTAFWELPFSKPALNKQGMYGAPVIDIETQQDSDYTALSAGLPKTESIFANLNEYDKKTNRQFFMSKSEIYDGQNNLQLHQNYNNANKITKYNDFIYEKQFRKKVFDFLYANDVKLFRSVQEGNILVKLMNITFTPMAEVGRLIYSFSATAIEIDENTLDNYKKYKIFTSQ